MKEYLSPTSFERSPQVKASPIKNISQNKYKEHMKVKISKTLQDAKNSKPMLV